jgi:hypothetical protein
MVFGFADNSFANISKKKETAKVRPFFFVSYLQKCRKYAKMAEVLLHLCHVWS